MKLRYGFVSNSSSTSFVLGIYHKDKCSVCGRHDPDFIETLKNYTEIHDDGETRIHHISESVEEFLKYYRNCHEQDGFYTKEEVERYVSQMEDAIKRATGLEGREPDRIISCRISYHNHVLTDAVKAANIVVLDESG